MSYCVNCGVELDESAKKCALCGAPVLNPFLDEESEVTVTPYPNRVVLPPEADRRYIAFIISMVMLIPNIVCGAVNLIMPSSTSWSVYVMACSLPVWTLFVVPFLMKKINGYLILTFDALAISASVFLFTFMLKQVGWFLRLALPVIAFVTAAAFILLAWLRHKNRDWPHIVIFVLVQISVCALATDVIFHLYYQTFPIIQYSLVVVLSCLAIAGFFIAVARNRYLRAWLSRHFFF